MQMFRFRKMGTGRVQRLSILRANAMALPKRYKSDKRYENVAFNPYEDRIVAIREYIARKTTRDHRQ
jgi:hypothetical protein